MAPAPWPLRGEFATVAEAFEAAAQQYGDAEAYVDGTGRLTFAQWLRAADALADRFARMGLRPGDVVGIALPPSVEYAIATMAAIRLGAIATGLNTRLGPREIGSICDGCAMKLVVRQHPASPGGLPGSVATLDVSEVTALWNSGASAPAPTYHGRSSDPAVIIWTSGTTGVPKGAWFDHANLRDIAAAGGVISAPFDRRLSATPFAHAGYMGKLWDQMAWVSTYVLCPTPWSATDMARLARTESITLAGAVPTQWEKLLDALEADGGEIPRFRIGVVATAPAPPPLIERARQVLGCTLVVRYAMTESPAISGTDPEDSDRVKARTVGRAQAGMAVRVLDGDRRPCAPNVVGDVEVAGGCVMRGYWGDPQLTSAAFTDDGWLRTNDTGFFDDGGNLVLAGRRSEMYIRGGYNVYPLEVENVLLEHPGVAEVAVVGTPARVIGEIGVAFVVASDPARPPDAEELASWVRARVADYKTPDEFRFVDALPRTNMLKVDKEALRTALLADRAVGHPPGAPVMGPEGALVSEPGLPRPSTPAS